MGCRFSGYPAGGGDLPDRLVVDLDTDGQVAVSSFPNAGFAEQVSRTPLAWPLDAEALEDLRCNSLHENERELGLFSLHLTPCLLNIAKQGQFASFLCHNFFHL